MRNFKKTIIDVCNKIAPTDKDYFRILYVGKNRIILIGIFSILVFSLLFVKIFKVSVFPDKSFDKNANSSSLVSQSTRGDIFDRNGVLIAGTLRTKGLYVRPNLVKDPRKLASQLLEILPTSNYDNLYNKITSDSNFVWLNRRLTPKQQLKINSLGNFAVDFTNAKTRVYPQENLFSHVLGYVNVDNKGVSGLEKSFDSILTNSTRPLTLTLDLRIQHITREELQKAIDKSEAKAGSAIVMDVNTGEVLAMVSLPDFDPNHPSRYNTKFNRASFGVYELGSTMKVISIALALDSGIVKLTDVFDASKPLEIGKFSISDFHGQKRALSVPEIFYYSSNIGAALIANLVGGKRQKDFMQRLSMLDKLNISLGERGQPLHPKSWIKLAVLTISYGHGIAITPLHLSASISAIINGGVYYDPIFVKGKIIAGREVLSKQTSAKMRVLMRLNNVLGSGKRANVKGYFTGGKTGTANKPTKDGYDNKLLISSFIGVFPMDSPKYIIHVVIDTPTATEYTNFARPTGGLVAAPAVGNITRRIAPLLNVLPVDENSEKIKQMMKLPPASKIIKKSQI